VIYGTYRLLIFFAENIFPSTVSVVVFGKFRSEGNKAYVLKLGSDVLPVYCHMAGDLGACGVGEWTLVIKMDGNKVLIDFYTVESP